MMDFLKSKCEDIVEFFICINTVSVVTFILDCNLAGLGTLILEKYHIFVKKSYKKKSWYDVIQLFLLCPMGLLDFYISLDEFLYYLKGLLQGLFCAKYLHYIWCSRKYNTIQKRKNCSVCGLKQKISSLDLNQEIFKHCICVCGKCKRPITECDACGFSIATQFKLKTYFPWLLLPFILNLYEWFPEAINSLYANLNLPYYYKHALWSQRTYTYVNHGSQILSVIMIIFIFYRECMKLPFFIFSLISPVISRIRRHLKLPSFTAFTWIFSISKSTNYIETCETELPLLENNNSIELKPKDISNQESDLAISQIKQIQLEQCDQLLNLQKKSEKMLQSYFDMKFEDLQTELRKNQTIQFAEMKNQQKLFLTRLENNARKREYLDSKIEEIKDDIRQRYQNQTQGIEKQYEVLKKQCKEIQSIVNNQTKQHGFLQNLVLDLKNSNTNSTEEAQAEAKIESSEINHECKICMDKPLSIALKSCGHIVVCDDCVDKLPRNCPLCRKLIVGTLKVYLP